MPISDLSMYAGLSYSLDSVLNALQQTETQLGTGKRVNSPSDDPVAYGTSVVLNAQLSAANNDVKLAQVIQGKLTTASGQLSSASTAIETAIQLATQGADASTSTTQMQTLAQQIGGVLNSVISAADTQYNGAYVFGGNQTLTAPYSASGAYSGNSGSNTFTFMDGSTVHLTYDGQAIFGDSSSGIIGTLTALQNALNAGDQSAVSATLSGLQTGLQQVASANATMGADLQTVSSVISNQNTNVTNIQTTLNNVVNLDVAQAASQEQEQSLQEQALTSFAAGLQKVPLVDIIA